MSDLTIPFYVKKKNECVACGGKNCLKFVDIFGKEAREEIRSFDHIECRLCGYHYNIIWEADDNNDGKMFPSATEPDVAADFNKLINYNTSDNQVNK